MVVSFGLDSAPTFVRTDTVVEVFRGKVAWGGDVAVFAVEHPEAAVVYAWSYKDDARQTQTITILGKAPINSALEAVQAYIISVAQGLLPR
ncbi:hypothetical protein IIA16_02555 [bacterium]|nr:hypothetical protein [bacterium]